MAHLADRRQDVRIGAAPAQVAAHPLADFPGCQRRVGSEVGGDGAGPGLGPNVIAKYPYPPEREIPVPGLSGLFARVSGAQP